MNLIRRKCSTGLVWSPTNTLHFGFLSNPSYLQPLLLLPLWLQTFWLPCPFHIVCKTLEVKILCWVLKWQRKRSSVRWLRGLGSEKTCWAWSQMGEGGWDKKKRKRVRGIWEERTEEWNKEERLLQQGETSAAGCWTTENQLWPVLSIRAHRWGRNISKHQLTSTTLHTSIDLTSCCAPSY